FIVFREIDPKNGFDVSVLPMDAARERKPVAFLHSAFNESLGQLSPDSQWMAYTSDETGQREVYVRRFPSGEDLVKISLAGGEQSRWSADGKELFFIGGDGMMMAAAVKALPGPKPSLEAGTPQALFPTNLAQGTGPLFEYDVANDGKRFLLATVGGFSAPVL